MFAAIEPRQVAISEVMSAARRIEVKTAPGTFDDRSRTSIGGPIESRVMCDVIGESNELSKRSAKKKGVDSALRCGGREWRNRETRGNNERTHDRHANLLRVSVCASRLTLRKCSGNYPRIARKTRAISTAPMAASSPLLSIPGPLRSIACCSVFKVRTPNITGTPVDICAS